MACLSYKPSPINLEGSIYSRDEVFDMQDQSLELINQAQISTKDSLDKINVLVRQLFKDLA